MSPSTAPDMQVEAFDSISFDSLFLIDEAYIRHAAVLFSPVRGHRMDDLSLRDPLEGDTLAREEHRPSLRRFSSSGEGWLETYLVRSDVPEPLVAVPESYQRAVLFSITGQSNSAAGGRKNFPPRERAVTRTPPYPHRALMPMTGTLQSSLTEIDPSTIADLAPACEARDGETPVTSALRWSVAQDLAAGRKPAVHIGATHGRAGRKLREISKGTAPYANGQMLWRQLSRLATLYGQPGIWCPALHLDQGEADRRKTSRAEWVALGQAFHADNEADIRAATGQPEPVWLIMAQLAATPGTLADAGTALAQQDLMMMAPRTTIAFPSYFFQGRYGMSGVHFTPTGHALRGEYHAKANRLLRSATTAVADPWTLNIESVRTCLRPDFAGVRRLGSVITIPLVLPADGTRACLDTDSLPPAPHFGFEKTEGAGGAIEAVELVGNVIRVTLDSPGGATLRYAYAAQGTPSALDRSGAWGNFRDDCDAESVVVPGMKLWNWLISFEVTVP
ncbi:hypothetical protein KTR66_12515 [Roseococcus sp. SDR]|uniref:hypothetical protein n=1 Tax=Roseococcus sp. SDR TaxID=2835532 RepID=UPI001BCDAD2F|nr:hypothetical protein [Roseococcus sp. SDR]MBS7790826.1 hypothetical protein [Roseococcus sp. SDR]MBV1846140.1 hypothetical protein [Roseococcus sp. SDR]